MPIDPQRLQQFEDMLNEPEVVEVEPQVINTDRLKEFESILNETDSNPELYHEKFYDPETDRLIKTPVGLKPTQIKYLDAVQNRGEKEDSYLGNTWNRTLNNFSRTLSSTSPKAVLESGALPTQEPELTGIPKYTNALTNLLASLDPSYKGPINSSSKALRAAGLDILGNITSALLQAPAVAIDAESKIKEAIGLESEEGKLTAQALTTIADMPRKRLVGAIEKKKQEIIAQISPDKANQANKELIEGGLRPLVSVITVIGTKDPITAARLMMLDSFGGITQEAEQKGFSPLESAATAAPVAAAQFYLDKFSNSVFLDNIIHKVAPWAIPKVLGTELVTELAQQGVEIGATNIAGLRKQSADEIIKELKATAEATIFFTALLGGGSTIYSTYKEEMKAQATAKGLSPEQVDEVIAEVEQSPETLQKVNDLIDDIIDPIGTKDNWAQEIAKLVEAKIDGVDMVTVNENIDKGLDLNQAITEARKVKEDTDIATRIEQEMAQQEADLLQPEITDTDPQVIKARITKLDSELKVLDDRIDAQEDIISERSKAGKSTKGAENKLDKLLTDRETIATELAGLETADRRNVASRQSDGKGISEQSVVAAESLDKDVTVKGRGIRETARKLAVTRIKNLAKGIRAGKASAKREADAVQKAILSHIKEYIENSPKLSPSDKAKFTSAIVNTKTAEQLRKNLPLIESRLAMMERKNLARGAYNRFKRLVRTAASVIKDNKVTGKYNPELAQFFGRMQKYSKLRDKDIDTKKLNDLQDKIIALEVNNNIQGDNTTQAELDALRQQYIDLQAKVTKNEEDDVYNQDMMEKLIDEVGKLDPDDADFTTKEQRIKLDIMVLDTLLRGRTNISIEQLNEVNQILSDILQKGKDVAAERAAKKKEERQKFKDKFSENVTTRYADPDTKLGEIVRDFDTSIPARLAKSVFKYTNYTWSSKSDFLRGKGAKDSEVNNLVDLFSESVKELDIRARFNQRFAEVLTDTFNLGRFKKGFMAFTDNFLLKQDIDRVTLPPYVNAKGKTVKGKRRLTYSRAELLHYYMSYQRDNARYAMLHPEGNAFTEEFMSNVDKILTKEEKDIADYMFESFDTDVYNLVNPVYRKLEYIDLPKDTNGKYYPISRELEGADRVAFEEGGMFLTNNFFKNLSPSFLKQSKRSTKAIKARSAYDVYLGHIAEAAKYVAYAEKVRLLHSTALSRQVRESLTEQVGIEEARRLLGNTELALRNHIGQNHVSTSDVDMKKIWDASGTIVAATSVALKPLSGLFQLCSYNLYSIDVSKIKFLKGIAVVNSNPKKYWNLLNEHVTFRERFSDWTNRFEGITAKKRATFDVFRNKPAYKRLMYITTRVPDVGIVFQGAAARYYALVESGVPHAEALENVANWTEKTQQPRTRGETPDLFRGFFSQAGRFLSGPVAAFNVGVMGIRDYKLGRINSIQLADRLTNCLISVAILPEIIKLFVSQDEDEEENYSTKLATKSIANLSGGLPIFGGMMLYAADTLIKETVSKEEYKRITLTDGYEPRTIDPLNVFVRAAKALSNINDISEDALIHYDDSAYKAALGLGSILRVPLNNMYSEWIGMQELLRDNPEGYSRVLGATQIQIVGEEEAQKRKREAGKSNLTPSQRREERIRKKYEQIK